MTKEKITLTAEIRKETGKRLAKLRNSERIPAVLYGNRIEARNISVGVLEFERTFAKAGESAIVELSLGGEKLNVLVHEVQTDPMTGKISHFDLFQVRMDEEVETEIPVEFVGESEAVKAHGGTLVKNIDNIPVKCLPADLPEKFEIDLSKLATFEDVISAKDIKADKKVEIMLEDDVVIALVSAPRSEEEMAGLDQKVEEDVTKVAGVVKETPEQK